MEVLAVVFSGISLLVSIFAVFSSRRAVHIANELQASSRGEILVYTKNGEVAYYVDYAFIRNNKCTPKDLDRYEIKFDLILNSKKNVASNIHDIELFVKFSNGQEKNITYDLETKTPKGTVIDNPLTINLEPNGAFSASYSATLKRKDLWDKLSAQETPHIETLYLEYSDDRDDRKQVVIPFVTADPLSDKELLKNKAYTLPLYGRGWD